MLYYTRIEWLARSKHSSLLGPIVKINEGLCAQPQIFEDANSNDKTSKMFSWAYIVLALFKRRFGVVFTSFMTFFNVV